MTYKELLADLSKLTETQLNQTVTVYDHYEDEFTAIISCSTTVEDDILDKDHFYLILKGG